MLCSSNYTRSSIGIACRTATALRLVGMAPRRLRLLLATPRFVQKRAPCAVHVRAEAKYGRQRTKKCWSPSQHVLSTTVEQLECIARGNARLKLSTCTFLGPWKRWPPATCPHWKRESQCPRHVPVSCPFPVSSCNIIEKRSSHCMTSFASLSSP